MGLERAFPEALQKQIHYEYKILIQIGGWRDTKMTSIDITWIFYGLLWG